MKGSVPVLVPQEELEALKASKGPDRALLDEMVNKLVHNAFINQSSALMNSLENLVKRVADGSVHTEPGFVGPANSIPVAPPPQPIPLSNELTGVEPASQWPYGMPASLWPPTTQAIAEASLSAGGQATASIPMITRTTVPELSTPMPTIPGLKSVPVIATPGPRAGQQPRTIYYATPDVDPALFV